MPEYSCDCCGFSTDKKSNYNNHLGTQKHIDNVKENKIVECKNCGNHFSSKSSLKRHQLNSCGKKQKLKNTLQSTQDSNMKMLLETVMKLAESNTKKDDNNSKVMQAVLKLAETNSKNVDSSLKVANNSMQALTYARKYLVNAPPLNTISAEKIDGLLTHETDEENPIEQVLVTKYRQKSLGDFLGGFIISVYNEGDEQLQSFWGTDVSRISFIVRRLVEKKHVWTEDPTGKDITDLIVQPLLENVKDILMTYTDKLYKKIIKLKEPDDKLKNLFQHSTEIINKIRRKKYIKKILTKLASYFKMKKNKNENTVEMRKREDSKKKQDERITKIAQDKQKYEKKQKQKVEEDRQNIKKEEKDACIARKKHNKMIDKCVRKKSSKYSDSEESEESCSESEESYSKSEESCSESEESYSKSEESYSKSEESCSESEESYVSNKCSCSSNSYYLSTKKSTIKQTKKK